MRDTLWSSDMTWQIIRMQGISPNPITPNASNFAAVSPIAIKNYYGIEAQPVWNGPWNGIARMSPKPSLAEMQALMDTFYEMPDGMPSKYNAMGAFLPFLATALPHALNFVKELITKKKPKTERAVVVPTTTKRERAATKPISDNKDKQTIAKLQQQIAALQLNQTNRPKSKHNKKERRSKPIPTMVFERNK